MAGVAHAHVRRPPGNISGVDACMKVACPFTYLPEKRSVICMSPVIFVPDFFFWRLMACLLALGGGWQAVRSIIRVFYPSIGCTVPN